MNRSKIIAIMTGAISIFLAIAYLIIVQLLDLRGEMQPAPLEGAIISNSILQLWHSQASTLQQFIN